jgi:hypothetical protein
MGKQGKSTIFTLIVKDFTTKSERMAKEKEE